MCPVAEEHRVRALTHPIVHRLFVLTDITSLTPRVREPDDGQSLVRLMLYSNEIDIEGLAATSNLGHGQVCRPELIREVVEAYGQVRESLLRHDSRYPTAESLLERVHSGFPNALPDLPVEHSIGPGKDTAASEAILEAAERPDTRPLWVAVWGGTADLAQALWRAREDRTEAELEALLSRMRIHAVGDQDSTGPWIKINFPSLSYITRRWGIRGMYRGGDRTLVSPEWVERNVRKSHGALGAVYPNYDGGDIWGRELGPVKGIKEGDTPSFLPFIQNGLNPDFVPEWGSWGGRIAPTGELNRFADAVDTHEAAPDDIRPEMSAVYRWRPAFQNDFAARMDWCVRSYEEANHAPTTRIAPQPDDSMIHGATVRQAPRGEWVSLDAFSSIEPHLGELDFHWFAYPDPNVPISGADQPVCRVRVPASGEAHVILAVTNRGDPPLTHYHRIILRG